MKTSRILLCAAAAALFSATTATAGLITTGLVGGLSFDGNLDGTGSLAITNGGGASVYSFVDDHLGNAGSAVQLIADDPANGTFFLGTGPDLANRSSSVSFWVRRDDPGVPTTWLFGLGHPAGTGGQPNEDMHVSVNGGTHVLYSFFDGGVDVPFVTAPGDWHHFGFTYDRSLQQMKIYADGTLIGQGPAAPFIGQTAFKLGVTGVTVDDFRFYDRALGSAEVAAMAADAEAAYVLANPLSGLPAGPTGGAFNGVPDGGATVVLLGLAMGVLVSLAARRDGGLRHRAG